MTKPHCSSPRDRREIRDRQLRLDRAERISKRLAPKPVRFAEAPAVGRCGVRDRYGHRCARKDTHEIHRAFGREWMGENA